MEYGWNLFRKIIYIDLGLSWRLGFANLNGTTNFCKEYLTKIDL